jgi:hypothetical protein
MKTFYTAYAKSIDGTTFYFIKTFQTFPDLQNIPPILVNYGMHPNFEQACRIAQIADKEIKLQLLNEIESNIVSAKALPLYPAVAEIYNLRRKQSSLPYILKWIVLGRAS